MITSEAVDKIAPAFVAAQAELENVGRNATNSHFRNRYATLDGVVDTIKPVLAKHGLAVLQGAVSPYSGEQTGLLIQTRIVHTSGQFFEDEGLNLPLAKNDPQGVGSAVTYGRRYSLMSMLGIAPDDDDDGNAASAPSKATQSRSKSTPAKAASPAKVSPEQAAELAAAAVAAGVDPKLAKAQAEQTNADRFVEALTKLKAKAAATGGEA